MDAVKKKQRDLEQSLAEVNELLGLDLKVELPVETESDLMRESQAVLDYWQTKGAGFREKPCKQCDRLFAYKWDSTAIAYCSIRCAKLALQEIGLDWNPHKPLQERWGRTVPEVVPAEVLDQLKDNLALQEDPQLEIPF
jgi:hypothetical protein